MSRVWLVTGCSRGLGRRLSEAVLAEGDQLVATARSPGDLGDLAARHGERVRVVRLDVTDAGSARAAVAVAVSSFGRLDVVVNNAGFAHVGSIEDMAEDDFRAQVEADFFGVVNVTRAALPVLRAPKVARAILRVVAEKDPPLRLLLGSDAVFLAGVIATERAQEDARWRALSLSTDRDGLADFSESEVARLLVPDHR